MPAPACRQPVSGQPVGARCICVSAEAAQADAPKLEVHFLDIGQGDSALLFRGDEALLIDGGKVKTTRS